MEATIIAVKERILVGMKKIMSASNDTTVDLFRGFMPRRREVPNNINENIFCVQTYPSHYFETYNPVIPFEKWAAVEVTHIDEVPAGMESLLIPQGKYAYFVHKGPASEGYAVMDNIFRNWLPGSLYQLDHRPHFEILGKKYKHESPDAEEEIFIPVKLALTDTYN